MRILPYIGAEVSDLQMPKMWSNGADGKRERVMIERLIRLEDAVMALNEDVAWLESESVIGIDIVEMRNRVLEWLYALETVPQKEYTEQQIRDTFNSGYACGMEREWVSCEDEMPIDGQEVIASVYWTEYGDTILAYGHYSARFDKWKLYSDSEGELIKGYEVVAWMPLPKAWEGEKDETD